MDPIFLARVENSKLIVQNKEMWAQYIYSLNGKQVEVSVKKRRRKRTTGKEYELGNQNGWYWSTIIPIMMEYTGNTKEEQHALFKKNFAPYKIRKALTRDGKLVEEVVPMDTKEMDTVQFATYCEDIIRAAALMDCIIPYPHERIQ